MMEEEEKLTLIKSAECNGIELDCYIQPNQEDKSNFWATREQIGRLLGYENPNDAIRHLHNRHADRLDQFSASFKVTQTEGNRNITRDTILYSFKGLLELCRYSNQPKADEIIDWLWHVAEEIRLTGSYSLHPKLTISSFDDPDAVVQLAQAWRDEKVARMALEAKNAELETSKQKLEYKVEADKDKVEFAEAVECSEDSILIGTFAKILVRKGYRELGSQRLFKWLREMNILMEKGSRHNQPYQKYMDMGWFELKEHVILVGNVVKIKTTTMITGKGQRGVLKILEEQTAYRTDTTLRMQF